jgi:predicted dehydrogenase
MTRVGFIGTGGISGVHLEYLATRDDVHVAALCDVDEANLAKRQETYGGEGFSDFREMLERAELDAVYVCTPTQVRREPLLACADRGLPVFCEKPVARTVAEGEEILRELTRRKARVQVGYVFRTMPMVDRAGEYMAGDTVRLVQSLYGCDIGLTRKMPPWFYEKERSGGALVDQATHNFDLLRMLVGEVTEICGRAANPVQAKTAGYTVDEVISLGFLFDSGAAGSHVHTWVGDRWRNEITLVGGKRLYRLDLMRGVLVVDEGDRRLTFRQDYWRMFDHENERFLEMVASGDWRRNPSDYADALQTLRLTLACDEAIVG